MVQLGQPGVDGGVGGDESVDVGKAEEPTHAVHHRVDGGVPESGFAEVADVELDVRSLDPGQRVQAVGFAPGEPAAQLVGVQLVGVTPVPGEVRHRGGLGRRHRLGLVGEGDGGRHGRPHGDHVRGPVVLAADTTRHSNASDRSPDSQALTEVLSPRCLIGRKRACEVDDRSQPRDSEQRKLECSDETPAHPDQVGEPQAGRP